MNVQGRQQLAERELARICASIPEAQRSAWGQHEYNDAIKRGEPAVAGLLSNKNGSEGFWRKQRVIHKPPLHIHPVYSDKGLDSLVDDACKSWVPVSGELTPMRLHKGQLNIDTTYQRNSVNPLKVDKIAGAFDHVVFGALTVADRDGLGRFFVVDGQHRLQAAQRRAEIDTVLCAVFRSEGSEHEARVFAATNMMRSGVTPVDKHRALITGREPVALWLDDMLSTLGIVVVAGGTKVPNQLSCISQVYTMAMRDQQRCEIVMSFVQELCAAYRIEADLIKALDYLDRRVDGGLENKLLRERLRKLGVHKLSEVLALARAASTGQRQLGSAVLGEVNRPLREHQKIILTEVF